MKENFLHFIWKLKRFEHNNLFTTDGSKIEIYKFGTYNTNAGPDFLNARIKIGNTVWAGNVEMHVKASDWLKHGHQRDPAYDNVILHVVEEEDRSVKGANESLLPCLELKRYIPRNLLANYHRLIHREQYIPCQAFIPSVSEASFAFWLERCLVERLEEKTRAINNFLTSTKNDWEATFFVFLARSFGQKVNAEPFEQLARSIPLLTLLKHKNNLLQLEAMLFGQAGLLDRHFIDQYPNKLKEEYTFLKAKYGLTPLNKVIWRFFRLRPANFPSVRIAQLAALLFQSNHLFSKVLAANNCAEIENMLEVKLSNYWADHYIFDKKSAKRKKRLGRTAVHSIIINAVAPFLFLYGQILGVEKFKERALALLEELSPEENSLIRKWESLGIKCNSAHQSQALIQLKQNYCDQKRCLECRIGNAILK